MTGREVCPTCGHVLVVDAYITDRELDVLSAWWAVRSVKRAAIVAGVGEQRAKNMLAQVRHRAGVSSNLDAALTFVDRLRSERDVATRRAA
jgi:hypothetical protein